jgi:hypothetical protein
MNAMLRVIGQYFSHRTKTTDERLDLAQVQELLENLTNTTIIGVDGSKKTVRGIQKFRYDRVPAEAIELIIRDFDTGSSFVRYFNGQHQVFIGHDKMHQEKHYVDLTAGNISHITGTGEYKFSADKKVTLTYFK